MASETIVWYSRAEFLCASPVARHNYLHVGLFNRKPIFQVSKQRAGCNLRRKAIFGASASDMKRKNSWKSFTVFDFSERSGVNVAEIILKHMWPKRKLNSFACEAVRTKWHCFRQSCLNAKKINNNNNLHRKLRTAKQLKKIAKRSFKKTVGSKQACNFARNPTKTSDKVVLITIEERLRVL